MISSAALGLALIAAPVHALPTIDHNTGTWVDLYDDSNGVAPVSASINGIAGQAGIVRDPLGRDVNLAPGAASGYWFTSEIVPASFSAWKSLYIGYSASLAGQVKVEVWDVTVGDLNGNLVLGPVNPGSSEDPNFLGKVSLATVPASAKRLRIRVLFNQLGAPIGPSVTAVKATFSPLSVLQATLSTPFARTDSGDAIQVRMPVSVSFVNATAYVAYVNFKAVRNDNNYQQVPTLGFDGATLGGVYTASAITIAGIPIPARSVYWTLASQEAGKTYAYNATFRTPNGLARDVAFDFEGKVFASNAATVTTAIASTAINARPRTTLLKNAGGTYVIGGEHYAQQNAAITLTVSPTNWWAQNIPYGAQTYFQPVVWDSFNDFIVKGAIADANAVTIPAGSGGQKSPATASVTVRGVVVPKNSVYWVLADMAPGQRLDLTYNIQLNYVPGSGATPPFITINNCPSPEAGLETPQEDIASGAPNACDPNATGADTCDPRSACLPIKIGLDDSPGFAFGKGDQINGSTAIITNYDDNPGRFVTWGQPVDFKMAVGNSSLARLDNVVVFDFIKSNTFLSASAPAGTTIRYWTGALTPTGCQLVDPPTCAIPEFYTALTPSVTRNAGWSATRPTQVTWVAYEIPTLRSSYCTGAATPFANCTVTSPTSVVVDLSILPAPVTDECTPGTVLNDATLSPAPPGTRRGAVVQVYSHTGITGSVTHLPLLNPRAGSDWEQVMVKPLVPDLTTSYGTPQGTVTPGQTTKHTITIQNRSALANPIDAARDLKAVINLAEVTANGVPDITLYPIFVDSAGGDVDDTVPGQLTITWTPSLLPNQSRSVVLTYQVPNGIRSGETLQTSAAISAADDCGIPTAQVTVQSSVASEPILKINKNLDYRVVDPGTTVTYSLTYRNDGTAPSSKTWVIDRVENLTILARAKVEKGEVWFSNHIPPFILNAPATSGLPSALLPAFVFTDAVVRAHFKPAVADPGSPGWFKPNPANSANARWVAFLVDNDTVDSIAISPSLFPTASIQHAYIQVQVPANAPIGQLVINEAAIDSDELLPAIGNRVEFIVSDEPGVELAKTCNEVVYSGEPMEYTIFMRNDTTNEDTSLVVTDTLPANFVVAPNGIAITATPPGGTPLAITLTPTIVGNRYTWTFPPTPPLTEYMITIHGSYQNALSGQEKINQVLVTTSNNAGSQTFFDDCLTIIQNTEVSLAKTVSNPQPVSGQTVTYSLAVANHSPRAAEGVLVRDTLPSAPTPNPLAVSNPLSYVASSFKVLTPGWTSDQLVIGPNGSGQTEISFRPCKLGNNGLCDPLLAGIIPGTATSTTIRYSFQAMVIPTVGPGKVVLNTALVTTVAPGITPPIPMGEDCPGLTYQENDPLCGGKGNQATVPVQTPWPDPYVQISAIPVVEPGQIATWTILYGNVSPESSEQTVLFFTMPDGEAVDQKSDFSFSSLTLPPPVFINSSPVPVVVPWFSAANLDARPVFNPAAPSGGWSPTPGLLVNHIAFQVMHCQPPINGAACALGTIYRQQGPFQILVKALAQTPTTPPVNPAIGGSFTGCTDIGLFGDLLPPNDTTSDIDDNDYGNNKACATVVTPGTGLEVKANCQPNGVYPGLPPGATTTFSFDFRNNGTQPDFGVTFTVALDDNLEYMFDSTGPVELTDTTGARVTPLGSDGLSRVATAPNWARTVNIDGTVTFTMGAANQAQQFALAPGDRGTITITARVIYDGPAVADGVDLRNVVDGVVQIRTGSQDKPEKNLADNHAECGNRVYRADVFVVKSLTNLTDPTKTYADGGDRVSVEIAYGNAGRYAADNVVMSDQIAEGFNFVANSVRNVPVFFIDEMWVSGAVQYTDDSGAWDYQPTSPTDPNVRGVRVVYPDGAVMNAPAGSVFTQTTEIDFDRGTYDGTHVYTDDDNQSVVVGYLPDDGCRDVNACYSEANIRCQYGNYLQNTASSTRVLGDRVLIPDEGQGSSPCCQTCCPTPAIVAACQADVLNCINRGGTQCRTLEGCVPDGCQDVGKCYGYERYRAPSTCPGNGYYQPGAMCNRQCCPASLDTSSEAFKDWSRACSIAYEDIYGGNGEWEQCVAQGATNCGAKPANPCKYIPDECLAGQTTGAGVYYSPAFPGEDEGNVLEWGHLIVNATFGSDANATESMAVDVFVGSDNNTSIATYPLNDGSGTYSFDLSDIEGLDPALYPELRVRARMSSVGTECMTDIVPTVSNFWGLPTGVNTGSRVIGLQKTFYRQGSQNISAWSWQSGENNVTDLHTDLPMNAVQGTNPIWTWKESVASDINDSSNRIVGWADPFVNTAQSYNVPDACKADREALYAPVQAVNALSDGGVNSTHIQWLVTTSELPGSSTQIKGFRLRDRGGNPGPRSISGVNLRVGYAASTTMQTLSDVFASNFSATPPRVIYNDATVTWTKTQNYGSAFDINIPLDPPFDYNPANGPLVIDWNSNANVAAYFEAGFDCTGDENATIYAGKPDQAFADNRSRCPISTEIVTTAKVFVESPIVWLPTDTAPDAPYFSHCLPMPSKLYQTRPSGNPLALTSLVYINERNYVAASAGATRTYYGNQSQSVAVGGGNSLAMVVSGPGWPIGDSNSPYGTPTLWYPKSEAPYYDALPIQTAGPNGAPVAAPVAAVTGLGDDDNSTVIGVGYVVVAASCVINPVGSMSCSNTYGYRAYAWGIAARDGAGKPTLWSQVDLNAELFADTDYSRTSLGSQFPAVVIPSDIDANGNIIGVFQAPNVAGGGVYIPMMWVPTAGLPAGRRYDVVILQPPNNPTGNVSQRLYKNSVLELAFAATDSVTDGKGYFTTYGVGSQGWSYDSDDNFTRQDPESGSDYITGSNGTTALGIGDSQNEESSIAWANFDGQLTVLGYVSDPYTTHFPLFTNPSRYIVGSYSKWQSSQGSNYAQRVFQWSACSNPGDTPRLDDWTVTYHTDKNPSWGFDVELADVCLTNISNSADISTTTPEISIANNTSVTSMSVNTADIKATMDLVNTVVAPPDPASSDDNVTGTATISNAGPGAARDVAVELRLPFGCTLLPASVVTVANPVNLVIAGISQDNFTNTIRFRLPQLPANANLSVTYTCVNTQTTNGLELTASVGTTSPTIDCNPDNDAESQGLIVGYYPNLWVEISGPGSTEIGTPTPYVVHLGNNGNTANNGTFVVTLPIGTTATVGSCPAGLLCVVSQPTTVATGSITFTSSGVPPTFTPPASYTVPVVITWVSCNAADKLDELAARAYPFGGFDAKYADNFASAVTLVTAPTGALQVRVDRSEIAAEVNKEVFYTFHFANLGTQAAAGTTLALTMPTGLQILEVLPHASFTASSVVVPVGRGATGKSLFAGDSGAITVRAKVLGASAGSGLASLAAANGACGVTAPIPGPTVQPALTGLHVLVSPSLGSACGNDDDNVTWTVTVTNPSANPAPNTAISVPIPAGLAYVPGSITGQGAVAAAVPTLVWLATIPAQGMLNFSFETQVLASSTQVLTVPATATVTPAASYASSGTLPINCEERILVSKAWALEDSCAATPGTFPIVVTVKNLTSKYVNGTLVDTFQVGANGDSAQYDPDANRTISVPVSELAPGASIDISLSVAITSPLQYGHPIVDRAVFYSGVTVQAASNQVAGAVSQCPANSLCTTYACNTLSGCVASQVNASTFVELCGNSIDDNCNGQTDEGFPTLNTACNSTSGDDAGDDCLNDRIDCVEGAAACVTKVKATESCDGVDNDCNDGTDEGFTFSSGQSQLALGASCDGDDNGTCANGTVVCNAGHTAATCLEVGVDLSTVACSAGLGECKQNGFFLCNGTCGAMAGMPQVVNDLCGNSKDDNCNGVTDLDFPLFAQIDRPCDSTATDRNGGDADLCIGGAYICDTIDRTKVTCTDDNATIAELCNGIDDDCDGTINEGFTFEGITLGAACDGPDGDLCATGIVKCNAADNNSTICTDDTISTLELCNGIDDNCDGRDDENWTSIAQGGDVSVGRYLGLECDGTNDADFCERGTIECNITFTGVICLEEDLGVTEVCNGQDDTCDCNNPALVGQECVASIANGMIDEGFGVGSNCTTDELGLCKRPGITACAEDDNTTSFCEPLTPSPAHAETCNAIDDDCDGSTDEPRVTTGPPIVTTLTCLPLETDITTGPPAITASTTATFTYVNPVAVPVPSHTTFECSLDGGLWVTCNHVGTTPSLTYNNLPQGQHTLLVRATRGDGAVDPTPDFWTWIIDTTLPDTTILSGPTNPSQNPNGTFVFGSPTPNPAFYSCVLDPTGGICPPTGGAYAVCPEIYTFTNLGDGSHTMCVFVTNTAGTQDPLPASYTWIIDTTAPETEIVALIPPKVTSSTSIILHYIDPTAPTTNTFECSLDGDVWTDCDGKTITYTALTEGEHVFDVRTIDPNGVIDPTPATFTWIIDRTAPCPDIATKPTDPAQSDVAIFGFSASEANVTYFCALDPLAAQLGTNGEPLLTAYSACTATVTFDGLADGTHTLWVYVKDQVGNVGTCRASYTWLIDTRFQETEITDGPTPLIGTGEVSTLDYIDPTDEQLFTFECSLDGAVFTRCDGAGTIVGDGGTLDYDNLPVGKHSFLVRACDFTKAEPVQCDPTPAQWLWEVTVSPCPNDRDAPAIACAADLVLECRDGGATVDLAKLAPTSIDACLPVATTTSASADVALGQTPLVFTSQDPNGNISSCVTLVNVVDVTKPTITCPPDVAVATDVGVCTASFDLAVATGNDTCQGTAGLLFLSDAPDFFIPGTNIVTHHVLDSFGNEATCEQEVVVTDGEDLVLTCSESLTVEANPDACEWSGVQTATATDNCSDELTVDVDGTYPVGVSPILFTAADAAGNSAECTTELTVLDVTNPVAACGTAVGVLPTVIRATATDACKVTVTLENVVCNRVVAGTSTPFELADCPIAINGDAIEITGRLADGELTITYDARAVDASGNFAVVSCSEAYDPDKDGDGIVDAEDNCALTVNGDQTDVDDDGIGDLCDNCPATSNEDQADVDNDGVGNVCSDKDKDGVLDAADNCPADPNSDQSDVDDDTFGDACDEAPFEGLTAEGSGGCAGGGGAGGLLGGLLGLVGIFAAVRARRR